MLKINEVIKATGKPKSTIAREANIPLNDFYQATNGKKTFFPIWRRRLCGVLKMTEAELFPEYENKEDRSIKS